MKVAIMFGLTAETEEIVQQTALNCTGESGVFSEVPSLAVCSRCNNIDSFLRPDTNGTLTWYELAWPPRDKRDMQTKYQRGSQSAGLPPGSPGSTKETRYALPNGLSLTNKDDEDTPSTRLVFMTTLGISNRTRTVSMGDIDTLIWSQTVINASNGTEAVWPDIEVHASECALYYCVKEYTFTVQNNTKKEVLSSVLADAQRHPQSWELIEFIYEDGVEELIQSGKFSPDFMESLAFDPTNSLEFRTDLQLYINATDGPDQRWNVSQEAVNSISYVMQTFFSACTNWTCSGTQQQWPAPTGCYIFDQGFGHEFQPGPAKVLWEAQDLDKTFSNIAKSMSNVLRVDDENSTSQVGVITRSATIYRIDWAWISLHSFVALAMSCFFTLTTISKAPSGSHVPVWKTSSLAALSRGHLVADVFQHGRTSEQLKKQAKLARVSLLQVGPTDTR